MDEHISKQMPWYVPIFSALLVLSVLFWFGVKEQKAIIDTEVEQTKLQRSLLVRMVIKQIEAKLIQTKISVERLARQLAYGFSYYPEDLSKKFDKIVELLPDGTLRSDQSIYNPINEAGIFIPQNVSLNSKDKSLLIQSKNIIENLTTNISRSTYVDTWYMPPNGGIVISWPQQSSFIYEANADFSYEYTDWLQYAAPKINPDKKSFWTNLLFDPVPQIWMLSAVSPIYVNTEWQGAVGHDIPLDNLLSEVKLLDRQQKSDFILFNKEGIVLASDLYSDQLKIENKTVALSELGDEDWLYIFKKAVKERVKKKQQMNYSFNNKFYTVSYIKEQDWFLITSISLEPIYNLVNNSFNQLSNIAIISIALELIILSSLLAWGHKKNNKYLKELQSINGKLSVEKNRYESLVSNISSMVYRCKADKYWTMEYLNGACEAITGYKPNALINNNETKFENIILDKDRLKVRDEVNQAITENRSYEIIFRAQHKDGSIKWLLERGIQIEVGQENVTILEGVITDITELKEVESKLQDLNTNLDRKVKQRTHELEIINNELAVQKDELVSSLEQLKQTQEELVEERKASALSKLVVGMAHELNTPLGNLKMLQSVAQEELIYLEDLIENKQLTQKQLLKFTRSISINFSSLHTNIQKMIDLSTRFKEISISESRGKKSQFNFSLLLSDCVNCQQTELSRNNIKVTFSNENITLFGYKSLLVIVINQLILNSIQHAFSKGRDNNNEIVIETNIVNKTNLIIKYSDNGSGIGCRIQEDIFEPFITSERTTGSLGLGLSIVQNIVLHAFNGDIKCLSSDQKTYFEIFLPDVIRPLAFPT